MKYVPRKYNKQSGFDSVIVIVIIFLVLSIFAGGIFIVSKGGKNTQLALPSPSQNPWVAPPKQPGDKSTVQMGYFIPVTPKPPIDACPSLNVDLSSVSQPVNFYCDGEFNLSGESNTLYECALPQKRTLGSVICLNGCVPASGDYDSECNGPGPSGNNLTCNYCMTSGFFYQCTKRGSESICANYEDALNSYYPQGYTCNRCY